MPSKGSGFAWRMRRVVATSIDKEGRKADGKITLVSFFIFASRNRQQVVVQ